MPKKGGRRWTTIENQKLREWWGKVALENIAKALRRSIDAVNQHAYKLGLSKSAGQGEAEPDWDMIAEIDRTLEEADAPT